MKTLTRIISAIIILFITININGQYSNYNFPEAGLSMDFPFDPGAAQVIKDTKTKQVRKYVIKAKEGKTVYKAEVEFYKEKNPKREVDNFFLTMFSKAQEQSNVTYAGKTMLMAKGGNKKAKAILCVYYQGNKVYRLSIKTPGDYASDEDAGKFFGSFNKGNSSVNNAVASNNNKINNSSSSSSTSSNSNNNKYTFDQIQAAKSKMSAVKEINRNIINVGQHPYYFENFANDMRKLNYMNTIAEIKAMGTGNGEFWEDQMKTYYEFETTFPNDFATKAMPRINEKIQYAYSLYSKRETYPANLQTAINELEKVKAAIDACKASFPNSEEVKNGVVDFYSAWDEIAGPVYKGTYLCDFHKENPGKIFYSKEPIDINNIDPTKFTTEFSVNDRIYGIAFLPKKMKLMGEPGKDDNGYFFKYFTNVDKAVSYMDYIQCYIDDAEYDKNKAYFLFDILPDPAKASQNDAGMWMEKFAKLSPRKHSFNVSIYKYQPTEGWASGEFKIDLTGMDKAKMAADAKTTMATVEENLAKKRTLPAAFSKKSAVFKDARLSQANMKKIIMREWGQYISSVLKIAVVDDGKNNWEVATDDWGRPSEKQNSCAIYIAYKGKDGNCYFIDQSILFVRDYEGGGKYSSTVRLFGHYDLHKIVRIACENIK